MIKASSSILPNRIVEQSAGGDAANRAPQPLRYTLAENFIMSHDTAILLALFSILGVLGIAPLVYGIIQFNRSLKAKSYKTTRGTLTFCRLNTHSDEEGCTYNAITEYIYTVDGKQFTGNRLAFGYLPSNLIGPHEEIVQKLCNEKFVGVRYDQNNPQMAVLSYGVTNSIKFILSFSFIWLTTVSGCILSLFFYQKIMMTAVLSVFLVGFFFIMKLSSKSDDILLKNINIY